MINLIKKLFNKIFLTKEISSKEGRIHFRRYRLFSSPWFRIYIHQILRSDMDSDPHDHPWHFQSFILEGSYWEQSLSYPDFDNCTYQQFYSGDCVKHHAQDAHKIKLASAEVWTLVFAWGKRREWGYQTESGWIDHKTYRQLKNKGKL